MAVMNPKHVFLTRFLPLSISSVVAIWIAFLAEGSPKFGGPTTVVDYVMFVWALVVCPVVQCIVGYIGLKKTYFPSPMLASLVWVFVLLMITIIFGSITGVLIQKLVYF